VRRGAASPRAMQVAWLVALTVTAQASLHPQPFRLFEGGSTEGNHPPNIRHYRHRVDQRFEDGSDFSLHWDVDTDPESLLELDLEHPRGVRIVACGHDRLVLQVPKDILQRLEKLEHITASHALHSCEHLVDKNLYHRVHKVGKVLSSEANSTALVEMHTKELATVQEIFRSCRYHIHVMPAGAKDPKVLEEELRSRSNRRLSESFLDFVRDSVNSIGEIHGGDMQFKTGFTPDQANDQQDNTFFNLNNPTEKDRFHWNYTYKANSSENPQYKYTFPGGKAWMRLFHPKVHAWLGFTMNLSSHMPEITQPPHETVDVLIQSFADFDLDIGTAADFDKDRSNSVLRNVLDVFPIPMLSKLKADTAMFMRPFTFHIGGTPVTVTPGWSINMKIFHIGQMKGTMRVGLESKLLSRGTMHFDTTFGEQHNFSTEMKNVNFTSPAWMIFTKHFQLGVEFAPNVWLKGGFGILSDVEMGFGVRPYYNCTISQELDDGSETEPVAIYPYRVVGLPPSKIYAVKISASGEFKTTAFQLSTGVIEFNNKVEAFSFPPMTLHDLKTNAMQVEIIEMTGGSEVAVAAGSFVCQQIIDGECTPNPTEVHMVVDGEECIVYLGIYFKANPLSVLHSNMQSISIRFPMFTVNQQAADVQDELANMEDCHLDLYHGGRAYRADFKPKFPGQTSLYTSETIWELGPCFTELWMTKPVAVMQADHSENGKRLQNRIEMVCKNKQTNAEKLLATGVMLQTNMKEKKPITHLEDLESERSEEMQTLPSQIMLVDPNTPGKMIGSTQIELDLMPCEYSAFFVQPYEAAKFVVGETYTFAWATHGAEAGSYYYFRFYFYEVLTNGAMGTEYLHHDLEVQCSKDPRAKVHRYYGGQLPCVFEKEVVCPQNATGKSLFAVAKWHDAMNLPHLMSSPPFFCIAGRRLNATVQEEKQIVKNDESVGFGFESQGHQEGLSPEAQAAFADLAKHCHEKPLKYSVGAGINYMQVVKNIPYAGGLSGGGANDPLSGHFTPDGSYVSNPYPLWRLGQDSEHRKKLSELLPKSVCAGGICEGMMLGCQKTRVRPINIPKICYKFSRTFNWIPHVGPSARHIIAYGLMILPAAVKEASREAQQMEKAMQANMTNNTMAQPFAELSADFNKIFKPQQSRRLESASHQTPAGGEIKFETLGDMEDDWSKHGAFDEMVVEITDDMHYPITDAVMRYLMSADAFRGLEDGREATHGPVKIIGYELLDSTAEARRKKKMEGRKPKPIPARVQADTELWDVRKSHGHESLREEGAARSWPLIGFGALALAAFSLLLVPLAFLVRRRWGYSVLEPQSPECSEACHA